MNKDYLEALERGILEFEKELEDDCNNEWLKRVVAGMKKCYQRLEQIDNSNPTEALKCLEEIHFFVNGSRIDGEKYEQKLLELKTIKQALLKAQKNEEEKYVIYCINNYHNVYMDYRGEPCNYQNATIFSNEFEAHKFLREKGNNDDYYLWSVFNVKDLSEDQKYRQE